MLHTLGRGLAPAAAAAFLLLPTDSLLTESGRPLATEAGDILIFQEPPLLTLETGDLLIAETGLPIALE
jgi:hypothetical protein